MEKEMSTMKHEIFADFADYPQSTKISSCRKLLAQSYDTLINSFDY